MTLMFTVTVAIAGVLTAREVTASTSITGGCFSCYERTHCDNGEHLDEWAYYFWEHGGNPGHDECSEGLCSDVHVRCPESAEAQTALVKTEHLVSSEQWGELATLIAQSPRAELNVKRGAVQFSGCGGVMAGHIPLGRAAAARLTLYVALEELVN